MEWHKLNKKSLPPADNRKRFLLWLDTHEDGGFPVVAAHVQYGDSPSYIRYVTMKGWKRLEEEDFRGCMWAEIEPPEEAKAAREKWENKCLWRERGQEDGKDESGDSVHHERDRSGDRD